MEKTDPFFSAKKACFPGKQAESIMILQKLYRIVFGSSSDCTAACSFQTSAPYTMLVIATPIGHEKGATSENAGTSARGTVTIMPMMNATNAFT
jgi:hypothetical protein